MQMCSVCIRSAAPLRLNMYFYSPDEFDLNLARINMQSKFLIKRIEKFN